MKILVACEESQEVCKAFRSRGHEAYSCDILDCSGGHPEWHFKGDVREILKAKFNWDMIIAFPPCTYLSNAGAARLYKVINGETWINRNRFEKGMDAKEFFLEFLKFDRVAIENPIPSGVYRLPKPTQIIQPFQFGHPYSKKTCLWLKGLPKLHPTEIVEPICSWVSGGSKKANGEPRENKGTRYRDSVTRSKTFHGIAQAMAEQWG